MNGALAAAIGDWPTLSLDALNARAALLDRAENKYVVPAERLAEALRDLAGGFEVLEIEGRTEFTYDTVYFDDPGFGCFRHHVQGRRRRLKIRSRRYVDSGLGFFEVKMKGVRGRTIKERIPYDEADHGTVTASAAAFLSRCTERVYGERFDQPLLSALGMSYRRVTLVGRHSPERVTIDAGLRFRADEQHLDAPPETTIVEVKSPDGRGAADLAFRRHGLRGESCSKYCVGLTMLQVDLPFNPFNRTLRNNFDWKGRAPVLSSVENDVTELLSPGDLELLGRILRRLPPHLMTSRSPAVVERIVAEELIGFGDARIRSYLEILVTRAAVARLNGTT